MTTLYTRNPCFCRPKHPRLCLEFIGKSDLEPGCQQKLVFLASAASLKEEVTPEGEKGMPRGGTLFARESSKIYTLATHGRKWCPGSQNRTPWSQNGAQWSQNEPTIVAKVIHILYKYDTNVIWHGGGSGSACDSGYIYIYIYIYISAAPPLAGGAGRVETSLQVLAGS